MKIIECVPNFSEGVDLGKIKMRKLKWLRPFYLPIQIFEYVFLTFSIRIIVQRIKKIVNNK